MPLNCIVDDSALVASVRGGALHPHSIQPWVAQNAVNIFVPISALERLNALRSINCPVRDDAQNALMWLDEVTTSTAAKSVGRVQLQGPDDQYMRWQEVEKYLLPDTPLSRSTANGTDRVDALSKILDTNMTMSTSQHSSPATQASKRSPSASPTSSASSMSSTTVDVPGKVDESSSVLSAHGIPPSVRPLLNFVVWRTHHEDDINNASGKYILVTNDPIIQKQASKFGVRAKLLGQLENILAKEGIKPDANAAAAALADVAIVHHDDDDLSDDEDRVVFDPSKRPGSSRGMPPFSMDGASLGANVIDPDHFGRDNKIPSSTPAVPTGPAHHHNHRGSRGHFGGRRGNHSSPRQAPAINAGLGAGSPHRGRGTSSSPARAAAYAPRGNGLMHQPPRGGLPHGPARGAANGPAPAPRGAGSFRGRAANLPFAPRGPGMPRNQFVPKPIDPDSYARPSPFGRGRGRGGAMHRLWDPSSTG